MDLSFGSELPELDVLIVGAGLSGLTSGVKILSKENSLNLKIIDAGRSPGGVLDVLGKQFVNEAQSDLISFLTNLKLPLRQREKIDGVPLNRCWDLDRGLTAIPAKFELNRYINMLELRMKKFQSLRFTLRKGVPTMERHICSNLFFGQSRQFMFNMVELITGQSASDINYDEFMCLCSSCGGLNAVIDIFLAMPSTLLELSGGQLINTLIDSLSPMEVLSDVKAVKIKHFRDYVEVTDSLGMKHTAQVVILAIPWDEVLKLTFKPLIPNQYKSSKKTSKMPKSLITQYYMRYNKSYWVALGYSGQFLHSKPFVVGYECKPTEYCGYMMHRLEEADQVKQTVLQLLSAHFGEEMQEPLVFNQATFELRNALIKPLTRPWNRVIWSSSSVASTYNRNLMGGAVQSGIRAAINALFIVRPQVVGWKDLLHVQDKNQYSNVSTSRISALSSRLNLYNFTFYSVFVIGLVILLNFGYSHSVQI